MDLFAVAKRAAHDAGGLDPELLSDFLPTVVAAAETGRTLRRKELQRYAERGGEAARQGVPLRAIVDLYLSASWRLWSELEIVNTGSAEQVRGAGLAVLRAADDGVAALAEGFQLARSDITRRQDAERSDVFQALLGGGRSAEGALGRAADLGLDLGSPHAVLVASSVGAMRSSAAASVLNHVERALAGRYADAPPLVSVQDGQLVAIFAAPNAKAIDEVTGRVVTILDAPTATNPWQLAVGRPLTGPTGVRASYEQAKETLELAGRLGLTTSVVLPADLAIYRVLLRDRAAMAELIVTVLGPMAQVRGGPGLLETLEAYLTTGGVATETARRLHLSVRAVTYRLKRIQDVLGRDPVDPAERLTLHAAVLGARLLDWPTTPLGH